MKILIIRFSSIGDIVLTTPVISYAKKLLHAEVHYLTKKKYSSVLEGNPNIDKLILFDGDLKKIIELLRKNNYDLIVDLHNNLRTRIIKFQLNIPHKSVNKFNFSKGKLLI
ncbi:MAG: hypothetical protein R2771_10550 [Saprospiraceae bacterium]